MPTIDELRQRLQVRNPRSPRDNRDYMLSEHMRLGLLLPAAQDWGFNQDPLDQGAGQPADKQGHCGGFGVANWRVEGPVVVPQTNADGHRYYYGIKAIEGDPTGEEGIYTRDAGAYAVQQGFADKYAFGDSVAVIERFVLGQGPLCFGTAWTEDMLSPDARGVIHWGSGQIAGYHFWTVRGRDAANQVWFGQNSWGDWALKGKFLIPDADFMQLYNNAGETLAMLEIANPSPPSPGPGGGDGCKTQLAKLLGLAVTDPQIATNRRVARALNLAVRDLRKAK